MKKITHENVEYIQRLSSELGNLEKFVIQEGDFLVAEKYQEIHDDEERIATMMNNLERNRDRQARMSMDCSEVNNSIETLRCCIRIKAIRSVLFDEDDESEKKDGSYTIG